MRWLIGGAWIAAAIQVASDTYNAYMGTYSKFPSKASDITPASVEKAATGLVDKVPVIGKPVAKATDWIGRAVASLIYDNPSDAINPPIHVPTLPPKAKRIPGQIYITNTGVYDSAGNRVIGHGR